MKYNCQKTKRNKSLRKNKKIKRLKNELTRFKVGIRSVTRLHKRIYEKLQLANEEIVSGNEEYHVLNEDLENKKKEIEITNERLQVTNTELKTRNGLLQESYSYSQTIIATIHEPMIILDSRLYVKSANKSFYKKFQVTSENTEGRALFELGNGQWDIPKLHDLLEAILSENSDFENFEVTHTFPELGEKVMLLNASQIIQKVHQEKLILLAIEDITERSVRQRKADEKNEKDIGDHQHDKKVLEREAMGRTKELEQKNIELETANKDLVSFTYISSHDLQEPLRKIQIFATCILQDEEKQLSDSGKVYLKKMVHTASRMRYLIEDLLAYSRTKSDARVFQNTDINALLAEVKMDFEDVVEDKQAIIESEELDRADVIPFQFRQLFHNLISNSLKFSSVDRIPRVVISSESSVGSKMPDKRLLPDKEYYHITFSDNGIGFDPEYKERIFEVFQRLHSAHTFPGTGIGLAICKRIVENHNGIITATGELQQGARFDIYIPFEQN